MTARPDHLFVRTDATATIGIGHFMRCLALAQYWRDLALPVTFLGRCAGDLPDELDREGIEYLEIAASHPNRRDLEATLAQVPAGAAVVLDGYHFDETYQQRLAAHCKLLVIDDEAHLPGYAGNVLLNSTPDAAQRHYPRAPARRLLGPAYILLRRELRAARRSAPEREAAPRAERFLVACGGSDPLNLTLTVLEAFARGDEPKEVRALIGPLNPHGRDLERFVATHPWVELLRSPRDVATHMLWADLAVAAAGTTSWELALCGVPSILLAAVDNQLPVGRAIEERGAAVFMGDARTLDPKELTQMLGELIVAPERRQELAAHARALVDGEGVVRVTEVLREMLNHAHR